MAYIEILVELVRDVKHDNSVQVALIHVYSASENCVVY